MTGAMIGVMAGAMIAMSVRPAPWAAVLPTTLPANHWGRL